MADLWTPLVNSIWKAITENEAFRTLTGAHDERPQYYISHVPSDAPYPYASTPGDATSRPFYEFSGGRGEEPLWPVHVWCDLDAGGPAKCRSVAVAVHQALTGAPLAVDGWSAMMCELIHSTLPMKQEGRPGLFQQVLRYRLMLYKVEN